MENSILVSDLVFESVQIGFVLGLFFAIGFELGRASWDLFIRFYSKFEHER